MDGQVRYGELGFTMVEVLFALLITGILMVVSLPLFLDQWGNSQVCKDKMEAHYAAATAGRLISDAIREAESVQWASKNGKWTLSVTPSGEVYSDHYYLEDKNNDGVKDFYRTHKGADNPVVSGIMDWNCQQGESGLWTISFQGLIREQTVLWQGKIRARDTVN
ncbi:type II secretion system protein [Desulfitobacterium sp. THU1]|uniref:type II secretion system protein n=1 Tax=Desulfitobacterium sp. THU1 TaxID=3138072 RepID=UPI00311DF481